MAGKHRVRLCFYFKEELKEEKKNVSLNYTICIEINDIHMGEGGQLCCSKVDKLNTGPSTRAVITILRKKTIQSACAKNSP
jgi:hypothetical protein